MSDDTGLSRPNRLLLTTLTSSLMAIATFIAAAPPELEIPKWTVFIFGIASIVAVIMRDAYGLHRNGKPGPQVH